MEKGRLQKEIAPQTFFKQIQVFSEASHTFVSRSRIIYLQPLKSSMGYQVNLLLTTRSLLPAVYL